MKLHVIFLTSDPEKAELVLIECQRQGIPLVLVDLGLSQLPKLPSGITLTYVKPGSSDHATLANAANRGVMQVESDFFLLSDSCLDTLLNLPILSTAASSIPKLAAIHADKNIVPGTRQVKWVPFFGTLYKYKAIKNSGYFDPTLRDISQVANEWADRVAKKGYSEVITLGLDKTIKPSFNDEEVIAPPELTLLASAALSDQRDEKILAPSRNLGTLKPWQGPLGTKPWFSKVTISIPNLGANFRALRTIIDLWRGQTKKPFISIQDTGTDTKNLQDLLSLEASDVEVHLNRWRAHRQMHDFRSLALDHAISDCRTPYLLFTHNDLFPIHQTVLEGLISVCCESQPVVGYQLPQKGDLYDLMVSDTFTLIHVETIDRVRASWNPRWGRTFNPSLFKEPEKVPAELTFNLMLRNAGIEPLILGNDLSRTRQLTFHFDHVSSYTSSSLYYRSDFPRAYSDMLDAINQAEQRLAKWSS
jgi:hypothetical protein